MTEQKPVFTTLIEYRVREEHLVPKINEKLGQGKRVGQQITWTQTVSDLREFARRMANLQAELDVTLTWRKLG